MISLYQCHGFLPVALVAELDFRLHQGREALLAWSLESVVFGGDFTYFLAFGIAG